MFKREVAAANALPFRLAGGITALGILLWVSVPRLAVVILPVAAALPSVWQARRGGGWPRRGLSVMQVVLALMVAYLWVNASWAEDIGSAVGNTAAIAFFLACWSIGSEALGQAEARLLRAFGTGLCVGMAMAGAYLLIDALGSRVIWSAVRVAALRIANPDLPADIGPYGTTQHYVYPFVLNLGAAVFASMLFPALLVGGAFLWPAWRRWFLLATIPLGILVVFSTIHGSSKVAITLGSAVFVLFPFAPRVVSALVAAAWLAAAVFVVPITQAAYAVGLQQARFLPASARARIVIWKHTGDRVGEAPLRGIGIGSTHVRRQTASAENMERLPGTKYYLDTSIHAHNFFLQAWYELGAIGAGFLLAIGLLTLQAIRRYPDAIQQYLLATFVVIFSLCNSTFSLFALWLLATIMLVGLFACLGARIATSSAANRHPFGPDLVGRLIAT